MRHGNSEGLEVADSRADQKCESGREETAEVGDEGEGAGAAFGSVLFGQPERIDDEIRAAEAEQHGADQEPRDGVLLHVKDVGEGQPDGEHHHHIENRQRGAAAQPVGEERHDQRAENGGDPQQRRGIGSEARALRGGAARIFRAM